MNDDATRYPLTWPTGWPRTTTPRKDARFYSSKRVYTGATSYVTSGQLSVAGAFDRLERELGRLGATGVIVSSNLSLGVRGSPIGNQPEPRDPGAAVYFALKGKDRVLACDRWKRTADNLGAIAAHIDAIRRVDRYGVGTLDQAFAGYDRLPPPGADNRPPWRKVFGIPDDMPVTRSAVAVFYRDLAKIYHPDNPKTGSVDAMSALNVARDMALQELAS